MLANLLLAVGYLLFLYLLLFFACSFISRCRALVEKPWLSLILVVRNQALWIEELVNCFTAKDGLEVIVIDDFSSDDTFPILERLHRKKGFSLLRMPKQQDCRPLELGFALCQGKTVCCYFF